MDTLTYSAMILLIIILVMTMTERLASHFIFRVAKVSPAGTDDTAGCTNITSAQVQNLHIAELRLSEYTQII